MAERPLKGLSVAILIVDGLEQVDLTKPHKAGATTKIVSPNTSADGHGVH